MYLEQHFSRCVPWNFYFTRRYHGHIKLDKCTLCFPSWCFMLYSWKQLFGNLDISLKEIIYVTAVQDGQRHGDFLFFFYFTILYWFCHTSTWIRHRYTYSGPSRKSGGCKGSSRKLCAFTYVTLVGPISACVVKVQPCAGARDSNVSKTLMPLPSRGNQVPGWDRYTGRLFQLSVMWTQTYHIYVLLKIWSKYAAVSSDQFSSVAQSCLTLCDSMDCSMPDLPVHHQLPEFTQTHIHWVGDAIQPSHPLSSPSPPAFNLS